MKIKNPMFTTYWVSNSAFNAETIVFIFKGDDFDNLMLTGAALGFYFEGGGYDY